MKKKLLLIFPFLLVSICLLAQVLIKDINPGAASSIRSFVYDLNGIKVFVATTNAHGMELWTTDGTTTGYV